MSSFENVKYWVARILRDNPHLRTLKNRMWVWLEVQKHVSCSFNTVDRYCRYFQNTYGMFLPEEDDGRRKLEEVYYNEFKDNRPTT